MTYTGKTPSLRRRELLAAAAGVAAAAAGLNSQTQAGTIGQAAPSPPLKVIDFHNHFVGTAFASAAGAAAPPAQRARWQMVNRNLTDLGALVGSIDEAGVSARVINTPMEFLARTNGALPGDTTKHINDQLADIVSRHAGRLHGLATVDAYAGDDGARELTRAVRELGLRGVFVESAKGGLFLDAPQARPTLARAAELGVPVFVHPISDPELRKRFAGLRGAGTTLNRATINSAALIALIESGRLDELPNLKVVVTTLAIGAVLLMAGFGDGRGLRRDTPPTARRHVYIDTMGLHPALIRSAVDLLGPDRVLAGTDWPIFVETSVPQRLHAALTAAGLSATEQQMVAGGNTLKLLGVT